MWRGWEEGRRGRGGYGECGGDGRKGGEGGEDMVSVEGRCVCVAHDCRFYALLYLCIHHSCEKAGVCVPYGRSLGLVQVCVCHMGEV